MNDWWDEQTPERQAELNRIARDSILALDRYPRDIDGIVELTAWAALENDVLEAHADWLARTKARFERRGIEWTIRNLNRYSRLREHE